MQQTWTITKTRKKDEGAGCKTEKGEDEGGLTCSQKNKYIQGDSPRREMTRGETEQVNVGEIYEGWEC